MRAIANLEVHVAHGCNLSCESCSHYSNQGHKGLLTLADAEQWMGMWSARLNPRVFSLLGGEPTVHPLLAEFVRLSQRHWPGSVLRLVTNGFFLHRHPELPLVLREHPAAFISLSVHHGSPEYRARLEPVFALLRSWVREHGIRVRVKNSFKDWTRRYTGYGSAMEPFDDQQPQESWKNCPARYCPQLLDGRIWKCGPLAYLPQQHAQHGLSERWAPYLRYEPLSADCSDDELNAFFDRREESFCGMCPARPERMALPLPLVRLQRATGAVRRAAAILV